MGLGVAGRDLPTLNNYLHASIVHMDATLTVKSPRCPGS
jgi:hypothetical protein